jgi:hydrogenase maturation protease
VQVEDGGTCGLDLMQYLEDTSRLIVIDAADFKLPPGTIRRLEGADVPAFLAQKISPHEINLPELLFSAKLTGIYPQQVIIFGVQPGSLDTSLELTPPVAAQVDCLVDLVLQEI